ncbi:MAG: hypothetical protein WCF65_07650 [Parachlamydiaceae bacterium]
MTNALPSSSQEAAATVTAMGRTPTKSENEEPPLAPSSQSVSQVVRPMLSTPLPQKRADHPGLQPQSPLGGRRVVSTPYAGPSKVGAAASTIKPKRVQHPVNSLLFELRQGHEQMIFIEKLAKFIRTIDISHQSFCDPSPLYSNEDVKGVGKSLLQITDDILDKVASEDWCLINVWVVLRLLPINIEQAIYIASKNEVAKQMATFISSLDTAVTEESRGKLIENWKKYIQSPHIKEVLPIEKKMAFSIASRLTDEHYTQPLFKGISNYIASEILIYLNNT